MRTAVEWLIKDLISKGLLTLSGDTLKSIGNAKEMEKQQIVHAWNDGLWGKLREGEDNAEQYYNETFKSE